MIQRSLKFSLKFSNRSKLEQIDQLFNEYIKTTNHFINEICSPNSPNSDLNETFIKNFSDSKLSYRFRQASKKQAFKVFKLWWRSKKTSGFKKKSSIPVLKNGIVLDQRFWNFEKSTKDGCSFDFWITLSTTNKGKRIKVPVRSYDYANDKYFNDPNWGICKSAKLIKNPNTKDFEIQITFQRSKDNIQKKQIRPVGVDIGFRKLFVTSNGNVIGSNIRTLINKASRKQQGSKSEKRARSEINYFIDMCCKQLFNKVEPDMSDLVLENLKNLKQNKRGKWNKSVNHKFNYWSYGRAKARLGQLAEINGVQISSVDPMYTSQKRPVCDTIDSSNRRDETFKCTSCGFQQDADLVGALNILSKKFGPEHMVPDIKKIQKMELISIF